MRLASAASLFCQVWLSATIVVEAVPARQNGKTRALFRSATEPLPSDEAHALEAHEARPGSDENAKENKNISAHGAGVVDPEGNNTTTAAEEEKELAALALLLNSNRSDADEQTSNCQSGKTIVLTIVDKDFVDFFKNWHIYASPHLKADEHHLVAIAEDSDVSAQLANYKRGMVDSLFSFDIAKNPSLSDPATGNGSNDKKGSFARARRSKSNVTTDPYGSAGYVKLMHATPGKVMRYLLGGCTVFYVDIDTVWLKDPFADIAKAGKHDLYVIDDSGKSDSSCERHPYFCGCFIYARPTEMIKQFVKTWSLNVYKGRVGNQGMLNQALCKASPDYAILPRTQYPPGVAVRRRLSSLGVIKTTKWLAASNTTVVHANWIIGKNGKKKYLQKLGLWKVAS